MDANNQTSVVYICSRYSGDVKHNTEMARRYTRLALDKGCIPITPHLYLPQVLSEERERDKAINADLSLLEKTDEVWVCGDTISDGMACEIGHAKRLGKTIRYIREEELNARN